jgi:hypothetical protein
MSETFKRNKFYTAARKTVISEILDRICQTNTQWRVVMRVYDVTQGCCLTSCLLQKKIHRVLQSHIWSALSTRKGTDQWNAVKMFSHAAGWKTSSSVCTATMQSRKKEIIEKDA